MYATALERAASLEASAAAADREMVAVADQTHFLRPLASGLGTVTAVVLDQGRKQQLWALNITDGQGRLIAHGELRLQNIRHQRHEITIKDRSFQ